jgi:transposase
MRNYNRNSRKDSEILVGIDVHRRFWHVTVLHLGVELFSGNIPGNWESLRQLLTRYRKARISVVYEAGFSGFWLYDRLIEWGAECLVTPPSLLPSEYGNRVKTDRRDSRKLAYLLWKGMLKAVWVPDKQSRYHRQVIRRRRQLVQDRIRIQHRIKSELYCYGIDLDTSQGPWGLVYVSNLWRLRFGNRWMDESFQRLLEEYEFLSEQVRRQTRLLKKLAATDRYRDQVALLCSACGIGAITAMEYLLELGDIGRFRQGEKLAAYVGLTPSQYSSGERVRMGRITGIGKSHLRGSLVEVAWVAIRKDPGMYEIYQRIKRRAGSKRAIVAVARRMLLIARRMLLDGVPYRIGTAA